MVSYVTLGRGVLVLHCGSPDCTGPSTIATVGPDAFGVQTSLALDASGNPVVAYAASAGVRIARCDDPSCLGSISLTDPVDQGPFGWQAGVSMRLDAGDRPVVAFHWWDGSRPELRVLRCGNSACSSGNAVSTVDAGVRMALASIGLDAAGLPVIAYGSDDLGGLVVLRCGDSACVGGNVGTVADPSGVAGETSLVVDSRGRILVAYYGTAATDLRLVRSL